MPSSADEADRRSLCIIAQRCPETGDSHIQIPAATRTGRAIGSFVGGILAGYERGRRRRDACSPPRGAPPRARPVPLHAERHRERGFNQSQLLAATLARHAGLPLDVKGLVRTRATAPQVGLGFHERKTNVDRAFHWQGERLLSTRVLLIDDVCTTGATLEACASALRDAGAGAIWALTLARPFENDAPPLADVENRRTSIKEEGIWK
jgi:hypothetical protein